MVKRFSVDRIAMMAERPRSWKNSGDLIRPGSKLWKKRVKRKVKGKRKHTGAQWKQRKRKRKGKRWHWTPSSLGQLCPRPRGLLNSTHCNFEYSSWTREATLLKCGLTCLCSDDRIRILEWVPRCQELLLSFTSLFLLASCADFAAALSNEKLVKSMNIDETQWTCTKFRNGNQ